MAARDLILGTAAGYHYGDVRPFLRSLDGSGFSGRCVLFVSETTRDLARMADHHVALLPLRADAAPDGMSCNALRHFLYRDYLRAQSEPPARVLLTDVRDVVFQSDPFAPAWAEGLTCAVEDRRMTIGTCPHNSRWVRLHLGDDALARVADRPILCSGTTVGGAGAVLAYLDALTEKMAPFTGGERMAGFDQGVHNVLVHTGALGPVTLTDNAGPILTLGYTEGEPRLDAEGFALNEAGQRAVIVHQYDRKPGLFRRIREKYA
ncbi:hypothetical protein [Pseudodesulfovibrio sp.]|uniref:hypothetical protein n=1 Tax=Pseudodesulfovibrio sp. TaxID=2035812 RepID=UPI002617700E|nr:hypothetical protein [Pseudodesulfovibrio sp.]MDD3310909.1 hypothetical protein [Pseudodesulfovibrio sp.]